MLETRLLQAAKMVCKLFALVFVEDLCRMIEFDMTDQRQTNLFLLMVTFLNVYELFVKLATVAAIKAKSL